MPTVRQMVVRGIPHGGGPPPVGVLPLPWSLQLPPEKVHINHYLNGPPPPLEVTPPPTLWSADLLKVVQETALHRVTALTVCSCAVKYTECKVACEICLLIYTMNIRTRKARPRYPCLKQSWTNWPGRMPTDRGDTLLSALQFILLTILISHNFDLFQSILARI